MSSKEVRGFIAQLFGDFYRAISADSRSSPLEALKVARMMVSLAPQEYQPILLTEVEKVKGYIAVEAEALDREGKENVMEYLSRCKNMLYALFATILAAYHAGGVFGEKEKAARED